MLIYQRAESLAAILLCLAVVSIARGDGEPFLKQGKSIFIDNVWTGSAAGFSMAAYQDKQYVAYYDSDRWMTVASRNQDSETWEKKRLDNQIGWDAHNYVTMAFDSDGQLHVSGNMHGIPLIYYRTTTPGDISTLTRVNEMTGRNEAHVTYPRFSTGPRGEFLYSYRDGGSGNGNNLINVYDVKTKTWSRYTDKPLLDGQGLMNAYATGPSRDPKGVYHMAWVWRDTPDCATNHDVSYARSPGSIDNWQTSDGTPIRLPLTIENTEILDRVQPGGGLLNSERLSFDGDDRPMVSYIKFDRKGRTQIYTMRLEGMAWKRYQTTDWPQRWAFSGNGSIGAKISFGGPTPWDETGALYQTYTNKFQAPYTQIRFLDKKTLQQVGLPAPLLPSGFETPTPGRQGEWQVNTAGLSVDAVRKNGGVWVLRWESTTPNRDAPKAFTPPPSRLELVELTTNGGTNR